MIRYLYEGKDMNARDIAVATIKQEHRSLTRVLHTMQALLNQVVSSYGSTEFGLLSAALYYVDDFQERCHHPKEDEYLFKALRAATSEFNGELDALEAGHVSSAHAVSQLHRYLVHYQGGSATGLDLLKAGVDTYATQMTAHMRREEELLERCADVISEPEWLRIADAFDENDDPLFGGNRREAFGRLYHRLVLLAPRKLKARLHPGEL